MIPIAAQVEAGRPAGRVAVTSRLLEWLVLVFIGLLLSVRLLTERVPILPRFLNGIEFVGVPLLLLYFAILFGIGHRRFRILRGKSILGLVGFFLGVCALSWLLNPAVHWLGASLFIAGLLLPIGLFLLLINLDLSLHFSARMLTLLQGLFVVNIVLGLVDTVEGYEPGAGDFITGTFGANQNQFSFFMAYMLALLLARWVNRGLHPFSIVLFGIAAVEFALGRFQTLWVVFPTAAAAAFLVRGRVPGRVWWMLPTVLLLFLVSWSVTDSVHSFAISELVDQARDEFDDLGKVELVRSIPEVWGSSIWACWIGVGPGTFNSRAFRSIADVPYAGQATSKSDVAAAVVEPFYHSRLADRYILPYFERGRTRLTGSNTDGPFTSFVSIPLEVGVLGAAAVFGIYGIVIRALCLSLRRPSGQPILAMWALTAMLTLLGISLIDNYLEVTRYTILVWLAVALWYVEAQASRRVRVMSDVALNDDPNPATTIRTHSAEPSMEAS